MANLKNPSSYHYDFSVIIYCYVKLLYKFCTSSHTLWRTNENFLPWCTREVRNERKEKLSFDERIFQYPLKLISFWIHFRFCVTIYGRKTNVSRVRIDNVSRNRYQQFAITGNISLSIWTHCQWCVVFVKVLSRGSTYGKRFNVQNYHQVRR